MMLTSTIETGNNSIRREARQKHPLHWFSIPYVYRDWEQANENGPILDREISRDFRNISGFNDCFGLFRK